MKLRHFLAVFSVVTALLGCNNEPEKVPPSPPVATVSAAEVQLALNLCKPNDGLLAVHHMGRCERTGRACEWKYYVFVSCKNGASFFKASPDQEQYRGKNSFELP